MDATKPGFIDSLGDVASKGWAATKDLGAKAVDTAKAHPYATAGVGAAALLGTLLLMNRRRKTA